MDSRPIPESDPNPSGLCGCGCGHEVKSVAKTSRIHGRIKGHHYRYLRGHGMRGKGKGGYIVDPMTGCWNWQGHVDSDGYGVTRFAGRTTSTHRAKYEELIGPIPVGLELDHLCSNPRCANPAHLEPVTHQENVRRSRNCKLAASDVSTIHELAAAGSTHEQVAEKFGISPGHVSQIACGKRWRDETCTHR